MKGTNKTSCRYRGFGAGRSKVPPKETGTMNHITISMGLPPPALSPNARVHWSKRHTATKQYRMSAWSRAILALRGQNPPRWITATVQYNFFFRGRGPRDDDNLISSMKAARDGMAEALMAGEDAGLTTLPITRGIDKDNPRVEITISIATESS